MPTPLLSLCCLIVLVAAMPIAPHGALAATFPYAAGFIGSIKQYRVQGNESLIEIARRFDLGFNEIVDANPGVDPFVPRAGAVITIPSAWVLPAVPSHPAIVVNIPEYRLYYFPRRHPSSVITYPLGIGDQGKDTPFGSFTVVQKILNPAWHVPGSIRKEQSRLPKVVPPGPENPMGSHALRLSLESILIHGTNRPWGIGRRSSHGCLRLYPEDIRELFRSVPKGMRVVIVNQPLKVATRGREIYLEVHRGERGAPSVGQAMRMLAARNLLARTDFARLIRAVEEKRGLPVEIALQGQGGPGIATRRTRSRVPP